MFYDLGNLELNAPFSIIYLQSISYFDRKRSEKTKINKWVPIGDLGLKIENLPSSQHSKILNNNEVFIKRKKYGK